MTWSVMDDTGVASSEGLREERARALAQERADETGRTWTAYDASAGEDGERVECEPTEYVVSYTDGRKEVVCVGYIAATAEVLRRYPDAEIGHDGDLSGGGDRTLCWESEEDAEDDDGARACASIRRKEA